MMDLATLNHVNRDIVLEAAAEDRVPFIITAGDAAAMAGGDFSTVDLPNLGDYLPPDWERVSLEDGSDAKGVYMGDNDGFGAYFVDKGTFDTENNDGGCLSLKRFALMLTPDLGYGVIEEGQFQMKVGAFRKLADAPDFTPLVR